MICQARHFLSRTLLQHAEKQQDIFPFYSIDRKVRSSYDEQKRRISEACLQRFPAEKEKESHL